MKRLVLTTLAVAALMGVNPRVAAQPQPFWYNYGNVSNPQIDANNIVNSGYLSTMSGLLYTTQNTTNFVNRGIMIGYPGYELVNFPDEGDSRALDTFVNLGSILVNDYYYSLSSSSLGSSSALLSLYYAPPQLMVMAANLTHSGTMTVGGGGFVNLRGNRLNLANSGISASDVGTNMSLVSGYLTTSRATNYYNPTQVSDLYWGLGANGTLGALDDGTPLDMRRFGNLTLYPQSPQHAAINSYGTTNIGLTVPSSYYYYYSTYGYITLGSGSASNAFMVAANRTYTTPSNLLVQVVFVQTNASETNLGVQVRFVPSISGVATYASDVMVEYKLVDSDVVTDNLITNALYLVDSYAAVTNSFYADNTVAGTRRPNNFQLVRNLSLMMGDNTIWDSGTTGNLLYSSNIFYDTTFTNYIVTNSYSAYSVSLGLSSSVTNYVTSGYGSSLVSYANGALSDPTNSAGRVELAGDELNLTDTRVRCDGLLTLKTTNLISTAGAKLDAPLCNVQLGSAQPTLVVSNLLPGTVKRLKGQISAYSTIFTNTSIVEGPTGTNGLPTTNTIEVKFHILFVGNTLETKQSVLMNEFIAGGPSQYGTNVVLNDDLTVSRNLRIDSTALTSKGAFTVPSAIGWSNFPNLLYFTNEGFLSVPSDANFAQLPAGVPPTPGFYRSWVNYGWVSCGGFHANADYFGTQGGFVDLSRFYNAAGATSTVSSIPSYIYASDGAIMVESGSSVVDNSYVYAKTDISLGGTHLFFNQSTLSAGQYYVYSNSIYGNYEVKNLGSIILQASDSLSDSGWQASNSWSCVGSVQSLSRPTSGDLLGTKITALTPKFEVAHHRWAAQDRGAVAEGFVNNAAVGWLVLDAAKSSKIMFEGARPNSALYVDYLEFLNYATNLNSILSVDSNIVVYFANANLPVEKLDGRFGNRLRWVGSFAGPNSSTNLTIGGQKRSFNLALVQSMEIDSDFDGTVNGMDSTPFFTGVSIRIKPGSPRTAQLSLLATGNGDKTTLEFSTNLRSPNWLPLTNFVNNGSDNVVTVTETISSAVPRYYRVRIDRTQ